MERDDFIVFACATEVVSIVTCDQDNFKNVASRLPDGFPKGHEGSKSVN